MLESNKQVFQKRKHTELLVAGFWKPAVPHLVLNPGVGTLLERKYGNSRVLNAIYTLIEHTYLSTTNSKQSVIKHQSQERVKKSKKKTSSTTAGQVIRCKGTTFSFFLIFFVVDLFVIS